MTEIKPGDMEKITANMLALANELDKNPKNKKVQEDKAYDFMTILTLVTHMQNLSNRHGESDVSCIINDKDRYGFF